MSMAFLWCIRRLQVVALCSWIAERRSSAWCQLVQPGYPRDGGNQPGQGDAVADPAEFTGKVAMITGSSGGIGLRVAEQRAEAGANVSINGRSPSEVSGPRRGYATAIWPRRYSVGKT